MQYLKSYRICVFLPHCDKYQTQNVNLLQMVISRLSVDVESAELFVTFATKTHEDIWLGKSHPKENR